MQSVLITGGAGFIGLHLARALASHVSRLTLCDNLERGRMDDDLRAFFRAHPWVNFVQGDLAHPDTYAQFGREYDVVFHLAATVGVEIVERDPARVLRNNILPLFPLLDWFMESGSERLVFSSTSELYAEGATLGLLPVPTPENVPIVFTEVARPRSSYGISKLVGEHLLAQYRQQHGLDFVTVRLHNVYGPRMGMEHVAPQMIRRLLSGENPFLVRSPGHTRAFCYVEDAIEALCALARCPNAAGQTVHVGNDREEVTILDFTRTLCAALNLTPELKLDADQIGSVTRRCPDLALLRRLTGFTPRISLAEGLCRTVSWYRPVLKKAA